MSMNAWSYDSKWQGWGEMTLNDKREKNGDSKCQNEYAQWLWTPKLKKDGGIECQVEQWLWMPKWRHNSELQKREKNGDSKRQMEERHDGFECQTKKKNNDSERQTKDTTLNAKRKKDMMDLNVNNK